jgi:hypothetical protein
LFACTLRFVLTFFISSHLLRSHASSPHQSGAATSSSEGAYLNTVFRSKLANAALPKHGDFSAAVAKEAQNGILKVRLCINALRSDSFLCCRTTSFTNAQADAKDNSQALGSASPAALPSWVLKNPNSQFAKAILRRMAKRSHGEVQVWCGAYVCE